MIAVVLGTIISSICWMYPHNSRAAIRWLGASIFSLTWTVFVLFLSESHLIYYLPHLLQTNFITKLLYMPFSFFFVRHVCCQRTVTARDLVHALPVLIFLIDYSSFYFLSAVDKIHLIETQPNFAYIYQSGWLLPSYIHLPVRFLLFLLYMGLQLRMTLSTESPQKKMILHYLTVQFVMVIYYTAYQLTFDPFVWRAITVIISVYITFIAVALLFRPHLLYNFEISTPSNGLQPGNKIILGDHGDPTQQKIEQITNRLESFMIAKAPYLQHGYSINNLANALQIPAYQLSALLNHHMKLSFNEYLNKHRIIYCKERILKVAADKLTLEALAFECGFNNRNSFTAAFKHFCKMTPSEFIRSTKNRLHAQKGLEDLSTG
jgi:AraC-like DNA-binding protein